MSSRSDPIVLDASNQVLGRLASRAAKLLLQGHQLVILNAEKALITGSKQAVLRRYQARRGIGTKEKGPYYPRRPDLILRRAIRGMLPYKQFKGKKALSNLKVYIGIPQSYAGFQLQQFPEAFPGTGRYLELGQICSQLGWEPPTNPKFYKL